MCKIRGNTTNSISTPVCINIYYDIKIYYLNFDLSKKMYIPSCVNGRPTNSKSKNDKLQ